MDRAEWTILGLHVWTLTNSIHDHACNNVIMYRLAWRYGAVALIIASLSLGLWCLVCLFVFPLELGLIRQVTASKAGYAPLARAGGVCSGCAGKSCTGRMALAEAFCDDSPFAYIFDRYRRCSASFFPPSPSPTVIDTSESGEHLAGGSYSGGIRSVLGMN